MELFSKCSNAGQCRGLMSCEHLESSSSTDSAETEESIQEGKFMKIVRAPSALHEAFSPEEVQIWEPDRFEMKSKVQDAIRNRGQVHVMRDAVTDKLVAVKKMPNDWVRSSHKDFISEYPFESEFPWQDIGCNHFLSTNGFSYGCRLLGVYRGEEHTAVVTELASEGDLFSWCGAPTNAPPGPEREALLKPLAVQIVRGLKQLHDMGIVHRDLSLENLVISKGETEQAKKVRVIDFGMASTARYFSDCVCGKPTYQAPEFHEEGTCDAYLTDAFAVGVSIYAAFMKDYPWQSTKPGADKCFEYFHKEGFRKYIRTRKMRGFNVPIANAMSESLVRILEGLLSVNPMERLTLGEVAFQGQHRRSVWDEDWFRGFKADDHGTE